MSKLMKIFEMTEKRGRAGYVQAAHKWGLPGVQCHVCGSTWGNIGLEYPTVDLSDFPENRRLLDRWPVSLAMFEELKGVIQNAFPHLDQLEPGTSFGPLVGTATGKLNGFVWNMPWTLLITGDALDKLNGFDLSLPRTVAPILTFKNESQKVFEFEVLPSGILNNAIYPPEHPRICDACGRIGATKPDNLILDGSSIPDDLDIFRLSNFTTLIMVTERFVKAVRELGINGAFFQEVQLD